MRLGRYSKPSSRLLENNQRNESGNTASRPKVTHQKCLLTRSKFSLVQLFGSGGPGIFMKCQRRSYLFILMHLFKRVCVIYVIMLRELISIALGYSGRSYVKL